MSKGNKVSKIKGGIWCPCCAARVVKEGQCSGRKGPGKGRSPAAARAPLRGPGREGRWLFQRLRPPLGPRQHSMGLVGPASWPDGRLAGAVLVRTAGPAARSFGGTRSLNAPFLDPRGHQRACTGKRPSLEERRNRHITAAVMRLHSLQVCASSHAARPGCYSAPPLSHTHSRREPGEGRRLRDGECW